MECIQIDLENVSSLSARIPTRTVALGRWSRFHRLPPRRPLLPQTTSTSWINVHTSRSEFCGGNCDSELLRAIGGQRGARDPRPLRVDGLRRRAGRPSHQAMERPVRIRKYVHPVRPTMVMHWVITIYGGRATHTKTWRPSRSASDGQRRWITDDACPRHSIA